MRKAMVMKRNPGRPNSGQAPCNGSFIELGKESGARQPESDDAVIDVRSDNDCQSVITESTSLTGAGFKGKRLSEKIKLHTSIVSKLPHIACVVILVFVIVLAAGIFTLVAAQWSAEQALEEQAQALAIETGAFFKDQLDLALLPLFTLAQFVQELPSFHDLPDLIGPQGVNGSAPLLPIKDQNRGPTHRNVTGICDDPDRRARFDKIAARIKRNSNMEGVLINLQLAPEAVVCLMHPLNNTEDFPPGIFLDNTGAVGHDLLTDKWRRHGAVSTLKSDTVVIVGPLALRQCNDCNPYVEKAFIARMPIAMPGYEIRVGDQVYNKWGFAVALINWKALIEKSDVYDNFRGANLEFRLTRTDLVFEPGSNSYTSKVTELAESSGFGRRPGSKDASLHKESLETVNNEWTLTVEYGYPSNGPTSWLPWVGIFSLSLVMAGLVYTLLMQNEMHRMELAEKAQDLVNSTQRAAESERELNAYISHEIRNPLSAAISACTFVSAQVNSMNPLADETTRKSVQEDIDVIDKSVHFAYDLLRNLLDNQKAANGLLNIQEEDCSVLTDIMEPAAAMIYTRNDTFKIEIVCPPDLVVRCDRLRLKQIVLNLGRNAAKFVAQGFIRLVAQERVSGGLLIAVEDSGPGVPASKRKTIFKKFQVSLDSLAQGTGIGLSLCYSLAKLMDGRLFLDETYHSGVEGRPGARFVVRLRNAVVLHSAQHSRASSGTDDPSKIDAGETSESVVLDTDVHAERLLPHPATGLPPTLEVLYIEDDPILRRMLSRSMQKHLPGWHLTEAANGERGITLCQAQRFDVVFVDQYMRGVDKQLLGTEATRKIRNIDPSIIICGLSANDLGEQFIQAGADHFLLKPFPMKQEHFYSAMAKVLSSRSQAS